MEGRDRKINIAAIIFAVLLLVVILFICHVFNATASPQEAYNGEFCGLEVVVCPEEDIRSIIIAAAQKYGVSEQLMLDLAWCESRFNPGAVGDGFMPKPSVGLFQVNLFYHPDVTREQALDPVFSSEWTAAQIKAGRLSLWACSNII